jgi:ubiquinone/menaquinone biosynthesis C-methylase UbiE
MLGSAQAIARAPYENGYLSAATGGPLRPGGLDLTARLVNLCELPVGANILDVGCGTGGTIEDLHKKGILHAFGVDRSELLLQTGKYLRPTLPLTCGSSRSLPVASEIMDVVMAECSLSVFSDLEATLQEFWRVLRPGGKLALSDIYARNPGGLPALQVLPLSCGLRTSLTQANLEELLKQCGFEIRVWEDHSQTLKYMAGQIILTHGSMNEYWSKSEPVADPLDIQIAIGKARLGYFILVAGKV